MMDFERSEAGLLIPEQPALRVRGPGRLVVLINSVGLGTIVNLMMVLIQLFTVWILWKTYQDTVIPNRQKELLSEQVAQLQLEQEERSKALQEAKRRVNLANAELKARRSELANLSSEQKQLVSEANAAQRQAREARALEISARASAEMAKIRLRQSQWSIYYQSASMIVNIPSMALKRKLRRFELERIGSDRPLESFYGYLQAAEQLWPDLRASADGVAKELRGDRSKFYTQEMSEEFAAHFQRAAGQLECIEPNFLQIRRDFDIAYTAAAEPARRKAEKENSPPHNTRMRDWNVRVAVSNATYKLMDGVEQELTKNLDACFDEFEAVGDQFFKEKGISQPTFPESVREEINHALSGR